MTLYEKLALIMSAIAIVIPILQFLWKRFSQKPGLKYYPPGRAYLFCNLSGSYIRIEGVFEALRKPISIKKVNVKLCREKDEKKLKLDWSVFISPVNQNIVGNYASSSETAHPFRIEADSVMCAFTEFADLYNSAAKHIKPYIDTLRNAIPKIGIEGSDYTTALSLYKTLPEYISAKSELEKELFWEIGKYNATISAQYGKTAKDFLFEFEINRSEYEMLIANIEEVLVSELKRLYNIPLSMKTVQVEFRTLK